MGTMLVTRKDMAIKILLERFVEVRTGKKPPLRRKDLPSDVQNDLLTLGVIGAQLPASLIRDLGNIFLRINDSDGKSS